jgi:hypothetical protein
LFFPHFTLFDQADPDNVAPGAGDPTDHADGGEPQDPPAPPALTVDSLVAALLPKLTGQLAGLIEPAVSKQVNGLAANVEKRFKALEPKREPAPNAGNAELDRLYQEKEQEWNDRLRKLEEERETEKRESLKREGDSEVKSTLSDFPWKDTEGKNIAFDYYRPKMDRADDGTWTINGAAATKFIKEHAARHFKGYHVAREQGGAGASAGRGPGASGNPLDKLNNPRLSKQETAEVQNYLAEQIRALQLG